MKGEHTKVQALKRQRKKVMKGDATVTARDKTLATLLENEKGPESLRALSRMMFSGECCVVERLVVCFLTKPRVGRSLFSFSVDTRTWGRDYHSSRADARRRHHDQSDRNEGSHSNSFLLSQKERSK